MGEVPMRGGGSIPHHVVSKHLTAIAPDHPVGEALELIPKTHLARLRPLLHQQLQPERAVVTDEMDRMTGDGLWVA
jgi:hypothetical protein